MLVSEMNGIRPVDAGRQDCHDLHSWGPGVRQCYIIHYIISGNGTFTCGKKMYTLTAGQSFLICPEQVVQYAPDENEPWEYVWVDFVGEQCRQILARSVLNPQQPAAPPPRQERLLPYFERLCQMELYRRNSQEAVGVLLALLGVYQDLAEPQREERKKEDPRIMEAMALIAAGYHRSGFCAETIARKMAVSRTTLNRLFQKKIGWSPGQYLLEYRLQQSEKLLQMGMTVKQTALSCGFEDPFYYSRVFRKHYGMPPSDYRLEFAEIQ